MSPVDARSDPALTVLRQRRAELGESMSALELALAGAAVGRVDHWAERVAVALVELSADFTTHIAVTEGPDGLHRDIVDTAPRLAHAVEKLSAEHGMIVDLIEDLLSRASNPVSSEEVGTIRARAHPARAARSAPPAGCRSDLRGIRSRYRWRDPTESATVRENNGSLIDRVR